MVGKKIPGIRPQDYAFTIEVEGPPSDVYHFRREGKAGTVALRIVNDDRGSRELQIGVFCAGHLNRAEVAQKLHESIS